MNENWSSPETDQRDATPDESIQEQSSHRSIRLAVWGIAVVIFAGFLSLLRVHTYLGVEAEVWDKHGRDYIWSIWWRARHDMVGAAPSALFVIVYIALAVAFLALSAFAVWLALVPEDQSNETNEVPPFQASAQ